MYTDCLCTGVLETDGAIYAAVEPLPSVHLQGGHNIYVCATGASQAAGVAIVGH